LSDVTEQNVARYHLIYTYRSHRRAMDCLSDLKVEYI
jgi:hypothetical protein